MAIDYGNILDSAGTVGDILAQMAKDRATGRIAEAGVNQNQANAAANVYRTTADMALKGPAVSAQQTALGDTLANVQPFKWTGETSMVGKIPVPQASGGLTPANYGPATRQAGADLARVAGSRVGSSKFDLPTAPKIDPVPQASGLDKFLSGAGALGSLAGAGGKNAGGGDLSKLFSDIFHRNPSNGNVPGNDFGPEGIPADNNSLDPQQLPGYVDPMDEYYKWLASQQHDGGDSGTDNGLSWEE